MKNTHTHTHTALASSYTRALVSLLTHSPWLHFTHPVPATHYLRALGTTPRALSSEIVTTQFLHITTTKTKGVPRSKKVRFSKKQTKKTPHFSSILYPPACTHDCLILIDSSSCQLPCSEWFPLLWNPQDIPIDCTGNIGVINHSSPRKENVRYVSKQAGVMEKHLSSYFHIIFGQGAQRGLGISSECWR